MRLVSAERALRHNTSLRLARVQVFHEGVEVVAVHGLLEGGHDAAAVEDDVADFVVGGGRAAGQSRFFEEAVKLGRIFDQVKIGGVVAHGALNVVDAFAVLGVEAEATGTAFAAGEVERGDG